MTSAAAPRDSLRAPGRPVSRWQRFCAWWLQHAPRSLGVLSMLLGVANLVAVFPVEPAPVRLLSTISPLPVNTTATATLAAAGLLLLKLGGSLQRRQRRAWRVAVVVSSVAVVGHVVRDFDVVPALLSVAVFVLLLLLGQGSFQAKADVTSRWRALTVFLEMMSVAVLYGLAMLYIDVHSRVVGHPSFGVRLEEVLTRAGRHRRAGTVGRTTVPRHLLRDDAGLRHRHRVRHRVRRATPDPPAPAAVTRRRGGAPRAARPLRLA